jgi:RHS repeat-associated protein
MVQAVSSIGTTSYQVNALGQRVRKTNSLGDTVFHYDSRGRLIAESTPAGAVVREYIYLGDIPVAVAQGSLAFIHTDHLNTPRLVADATGTTVWRWDQQEPFGTNPANDDPDGNSVAFDLPLRLPGQRYDAETGLHYNLRRDYEPAIGRYVESDPIGLDGGLNTYAYVAASPLRFIDPKGLAYCEYSITTGHMVCQPNDPANGWFSGYFVSGNNVIPGCKDNPDCMGIRNVGPIPTGCWTWGGRGSTPDRIFLSPVSGNDMGRTDLQTHACAFPFGPARNPKTACSNGCVASTPDVIRRLNALIDAEPGSVLCVMQ